MSALVQSESYRDLLRILNTNVDGKIVIQHALTRVRGLGLRYVNTCLKIANIDPFKRAGELTRAEEELLMKIIENPLEYKVPVWMLNRRRDFDEGTDKHNTTTAIAVAFRMDLERLRKIRAHRGIRHQNGLKVRGQHTKATGRRNNTVGVSKVKK